MTGLPAPWATVWVTVALVSWAFGAVAVTRRCCAAWRLAPFGATAVTYGIAIAGFLVPCAIVARFGGRFDAGLFAAALAGVALCVLMMQRPPAPLPSSPVPGAFTSRAVWAVQVGLLAMYAYLSWQYQMHDEHALFGHKAIVEQLRRDVYPLYYPPLPGEEARYHYGFDLLAGALARGYGLSADWAIDLVGLLLVWTMGWAAAAIAVDEGAERSAPLAAIAIHFGAGLAFLLLAGVDGRHPRCLAQYHHPTCQVELFPTQLLNVFQHPVAVGVPLFLVFVLLAPRLVLTPTPWQRRSSSDAPASGRTALAAVAVIVLGGLAVGQFVYFALGALAALAAALLAWLRRWARAADVAVLAAVLAAGLLVAVLEGGMLAPNPSLDPHLVGLRPTFGFPKGESVLGIGWHHLVNLGIGIVLWPVFAVVAVRRCRPQVALLAAFACGGVLVAHLFFYSRSWDIVKFPSAASFALSLLYVVVIDERLRAWFEPPEASSRSRRYAGVWARRTGAVLLLGSGVTSAIFTAVPLDGSLRLYNVGRWRGDPLVRQTIDWWRAHDYQSGDVIYAQSNIAKELSVFGGLSVVGQDVDLFYMGLDRAVLRRLKRNALRLRTRLDPSALRALNVRWLMFSNEEIRNLGPRARRILENPPDWLSLAATFEADSPAKNRRIWRVARDIRTTPKHTKPKPASRSSGTRSRDRQPAPTPTAPR